MITDTLHIRVLVQEQDYTDCLVIIRHHDTSCIAADHSFNGIQDIHIHAVLRFLSCDFISVSELQRDCLISVSAEILMIVPGNI